MRLNAFATAQHLEETGAIQAHTAMMSPEDRHRLAFVLQVCDELKIDRSFENVLAVSRAIDKEDIEPHVAHEYPKWVEAGDGSDVVVHDEAQETFAAGLKAAPNAKERKKPSPYPKAEAGEGDGEPFPSYVAPAAPIAPPVLTKNKTEDVNTVQDKPEHVDPPQDKPVDIETQDPDVPAPSVNVSPRATPSRPSFSRK